MEKPVFSILMCVYNYIELLEKSIKSVTGQEETAWELLILDNSDRNREAVWQVLTEYAREDSRIHIYRAERNEGWAKGTAHLLEYAKGDYMTFLAADDFLLPGALRHVRKAIEKAQPDIVWVGNGFYQYEKNHIRRLGASVLEHEMIIENKHASNIRLIMENIFYNSMFHYERTEFLKRNQINFFEPYYGDCAGMAKAFTEAERMLAVDAEIYGLTGNTSQSRGTFYWDGEEYIFVSQWECIKASYVRDCWFSFSDARYCAMAILKNEIGNIGSLVHGSICVNKEMNPIEKDLHERFLQIQKILENAVIQEMAQLYGRFEYEEEILNALRYLCQAKSGEPEFWEEEKGWLGGLAAIVKEASVDDTEDVIRKFLWVLTDKDNIGMFGMGAFLKYADGLLDEEVLKYMEQIQQILNAYSEWKKRFTEKIWTDYHGKELTGECKAGLAAFCKYILDH